MRVKEAVEQRKNQQRPAGAQALAAGKHPIEIVNLMGLWGRRLGLDLRTPGSPRRRRFRQRGDESPGEENALSLHQIDTRILCHGFY